MKKTNTITSPTLLIIANCLLPIACSLLPIFSNAQTIASDDFERHLLGNNWTIYFGSGSVQIVDSSDLGFPVSGYFGLLGWTASAFAADQYSEIIVSPDKIDSMLCQAFVRRRSSDLARYGFHWNNIGQWEIKYDGVPTAQTRILASVIGAAPLGGDTIRTEITGMTIRGYLNGVLMLQATDTAFTTSNPITTTGVPGIAYRFTTTFPPVFPAPVIEQWNGGDLPVTGLINILKQELITIYPNPASTEININFLPGSNFQIEIINTLGEIVIKTKNKSTMDVSQLPNGIYFLKVNESSNFYPKKFSKQ